MFRASFSAHHPLPSSVRMEPVPSWLCLKAVIKTCMKLTSAECTVKNSWWWAEKMPETCRVLWHNKIGIIGVSGWLFKKKFSVYFLIFLYIVILCCCINSWGYKCVLYKITWSETSFGCMSGYFLWRWVALSGYRWVLSIIHFLPFILVPPLCFVPVVHTEVCVTCWLPTLMYSDSWCFSYVC